MRPQFLSRVVALLILTVVGNLFAQTNGPQSLAGLVLSEIPALDAERLQDQTGLEEGYP
jgi:hypothetical protein